MSGRGDSIQVGLVSVALGRQQCSDHDHPVDDSGRVLGRSHALGDAHCQLPPGALITGFAALAADAHRAKCPPVVGRKGR